MFGRKKKPRMSLDDLTRDESPEDSTSIEQEQADPETDLTEQTESDPWIALDESRDWRDDGPFDISEVDLDADNVARIDLGTLILTPFEGMQLQLQLNQDQTAVQAILVTDGNSALEVALFASPTGESMIPEIREGLMQGTREQGGTPTLQEGPFGTEIKRVLPAPASPTGEKQVLISRTWLTPGPRWLLRGVLMGPAALETGNEGKTELLYEFFSNIVVNRGDEPRVPNDLIPMSIPENFINPAVNG